MAITDFFFVLVVPDLPLHLCIFKTQWRLFRARVGTDANGAEPFYSANLRENLCPAVDIFRLTLIITNKVMTFYNVSTASISVSPDGGIAHDITGSTPTTDPDSLETDFPNVVRETSIVFEYLIIFRYIFSLHFLWRRGYRCLLYV